MPITKVFLHFESNRNLTLIDKLFLRLPTSGVWSALHMPYTNTTWTYQDCEPISVDVTVNIGSGGSTGKCAVIKTNYSMMSENCNDKKMFICQRNAGNKFASFLLTKEINYMSVKHTYYSMSIILLTRYLYLFNTIALSI